MRDDRVGLCMIAASLGVIVVITGLLLQEQLEARRDQARVQGVSLVRLLSRIPYPQLLPSGGQKGPLEVVKHAQGSPDFAYASVVDPTGRRLAEVAAPGAIVPTVPVGPDPSSWIGQRQLEVAGSGTVHEFFAPVLAGGEVVAHVRVGFFDPGYGLVLEQAPFLALLAFPIFLLTPLAYLLIRREVRPLSLALSQLDAASTGGAPPELEVEAGGELGGFFRACQRFLEEGEQRFRELRREHDGLLASSKIVNYQKGRIESMLETLPDAALVLDESGTVNYANQKLESLVGVPLDEALGRAPHEWCRNTDLLAFLARFHGSGDRLSRTDSLEFSPDESGQRTVRVVGHPLVPTTSGLAVPGTLFLFRDITAEALERAGQAEFVGHIAHELKSPLNVLGMYSESLLAKEGEEEAFRIEACNVIHDEVERLSSLIGTLLSIAHIESGSVSLDRQRVRLPEFLRDILDTISRSHQGEDLEFELDAPDDLLPIWTDKDLLRVAINNLLTNAAKYNRANGTVGLSAAETEDAVAIRVRDTGIGISTEDQRRIFEKFFRTEESARGVPGHGLGLTLSKQIVELHGGRIELCSVPGEGSEFAVVLPKTPALVREQEAS